MQPRPCCWWSVGVTRWYCVWHVFPRLSSGRQPSDGLWARSASERGSERTALYVPRTSCACVHRGHLWLCSRSSPIILAPHVRRKFREVKPPAQRHTAGEWLSRDEPRTVWPPRLVPLCFLAQLGARAHLLPRVTTLPLGENENRKLSCIPGVVATPFPSPPHRFGEG